MWRMVLQLLSRMVLQLLSLSVRQAQNTQCAEETQHKCTVVCKVCVRASAGSPTSFITARSISTSLRLAFCW